MIMVHVKVVSVTLSLIVLCLLSFANATVYYIRPLSDNTNCSEPCYTMQEYVSQMTDLMAPNITLLLLPGNHSLDSMLTFCNLSFLELVTNTTSISDDDHLQSTGLVCTSSGRLSIESVDDVYISGLSFYGCARTTIRGVGHFIMEDSTIQVINSYRNVPYLDLHSVQDSSLLRITVSSSAQSYSKVMSVFNSSLLLSQCVLSNFEVEYNSESLFGIENSSIWIEFSIFTFIRIHSGHSIVRARYSNVTVANTSFTNSTVNDCCSSVQVIWLESSTLLLYNSTISNWYARSNPYGIQAIESTRSTIDISNSIFTNNSYNTGLTVRSHSSIQIQNSTFSLSMGNGPIVSIHNSEAIFDSVVFNNSSIVCIQASESSLTIQNNSTFHNNTQTVLTASECTSVTIASSTFRRNVPSSSYGGVMYVYRTSHFTVTDTAFDSNVAYRGGAIYAYDSTISLVLDTFVNNVASQNGGAMGLDDSNATVTNCTFTNNTALQRNGGCIDASRSNISVIHSIFEHNVANEHGGVINTRRCTLNFTNSILNNNTAGDDGGAIDSDDDFITFSSSVFHSNTARRDGGAFNADRATFVISYCTFHDNVADNQGGAIDIWNGSISIQHSTFTGNIATTDDGGAIKFGEILESIGSLVFNSTFHNNTAGDNGGAVYTYEGSITISSCAFQENSAITDGGALRARDGTFVISSSTFHKNTADDDGGAVHFWNGSIHIQNSIFSGNSATRHDGGAARLSESSLTLSNCLFFDNSAIEEDGGAVRCWNCSSMIIQNCTFTNNTAGRAGGSVEMSESTLNITFSLFNNNRAGRHGGGVNCWRCNVFVNFSNFSNNLAVNSGGGMQADRGIFIINHNMFHNNTSHRNGGSLSIGEGDVTINNNTFIANTAYRYGGSVNVHESSVDLAMCRFEGNVALGRNGGGLHSWMCNISIINCDFVHNRAGDIGGGAIASSTFNNLIVTVVNNTFANNTCGGYGGGLGAGNGNITIRNNSFIHNSAGVEGGAINSWRATVEIELSVFVHNIAMESGGAISVSNSTLSISNCLLSNNTATERHGGGIHLSSNSTPVVIQDTIIENSAAGHSGGGLQGADGYIYIADVVFRNNIAQFEGGAIDTGIATLVSIHNSSFVSNRAKLHGGVLNTGLTKSLLITNSVFEGNTAEDRGGVVQAHGESIYIADSQFIGNTALYSGGILDTVGSSARMSECEFINNVANKDGGVANVVGSNITTYNCYFENNTAHRDGGIVEASDSNVFLENSVFVNNTATNRDGGVIGALETNATMRGSTFLGNRAGRDGGVCQVADGHVYIVNSTISDSHAVGRDGGVIDALHSNITIDNTHFNNNTAGRDGGVALISHSSLTLTNSTLSNNSVTRNGGAIMSEISIISTRENVLENNEGGWGGGIFSEESNITLAYDTYSGNTAVHNGGAVHSLNSTVTVLENSFQTNFAVKGGALFTTYGSVRVTDSIFMCNRADYGAAFVAFNDSITTENNVYANNTADSDAGALHIDSSTIALVNETFYSNSAVDRAGVLMATNTLLSSRVIRTENNRAGQSTIYMDTCVSNFSGVKSFVNNTGSVVIVNSNVSFHEETNFINGRAEDHFATHKLAEGGAITAYDSHVTLSDVVTMRNNRAQNGGAIRASRSIIQIPANASFTHNSAVVSGGVFHLEQSEVNLMGNVVITNNMALQKGGGILAASSLVNLTRGSLQFTENSASMGGAIALEHYSKLYIIKRYPDIAPESTHFLQMNFNGNLADYGGAIYVSDNTTPDTCASTSLSQSSRTNECFFQVLLATPNTMIPQSIETFFFNNTARVAGSALYGGLLDRCTINPSAEIFHRYRELTMLDGVSYIRNTTNISLNTISSAPVRLCFCNNGIPDCESDIPVLSAARGGFQISAAALDHMNNAQEAQVFTSVMHHNTVTNSDEWNNQMLSNECTHLQYSDIQESVLLSLHTDGPCKDLGMSQSYIGVLVDSSSGVTYDAEQTTTPAECSNTNEFNTIAHNCDVLCPIGFVQQNTSRVCHCVCDPTLKPYITNCSSETGNLLREGDFWLDYTNSTDQGGFLIHANCPLDYCHPSSEQVLINFATGFNGADAQCDHNRTGMLCGGCEKSLSVIVGSSKCASCSNHSLALLIPIGMLGVALVAFIVICNLTVSVGTLNAFVVYANIVIAHSYIFLPFTKPNIITIFIAWMSLDLGIHTCLYDGMDTYAKTWLQLVFPLYVIILTLLTAVISRFSKRVAKFLTRERLMNLSSTVIFLSFMKLTRVMMVVLSFTRITLPDGSVQTLWLYDPTVVFLTGKHISIFIVAVSIGVVEVSFAGLLFCGPWILNRSGWNFFKQKTIRSFMGAYYAPYNPRHCYWFGLLLFFQLILCLVSVVNSTANPNIVLFSIITITGFVILLKVIIRDRMYKNWQVDILESVALFDLVVFASATLFVRTTTGNQGVVAYLCVSIIMIAFGIVLAYHAYRYLLKNSKLWKSVKSFSPALFIERKGKGTSSELPLESVSQCTIVEEIKQPLDQEITSSGCDQKVDISNEQL